tara:strand:+ start:3222 stop:3602 length:381 start_codon:yes stop_codon:yes gene_type:complete
MTVKILVLKSGEDVIAEVKEMVSSDKVIGYYLTKPCVVKLRNANPVTDDELDPDQPENQTELAVTMYPWAPLAKERSVPVPADWVVTIFSPVDKIHDMYKEDILENGRQDDQTNSSDQPADTGLTD